VKECRNTCRTIFLTASLSALVLSCSACGGPSATAETTPTVINPTEDNESTALTILSIADGTVLVMRPGETDWISGEAGMNLEEDYKIKTGGGGHATITFFEGSTIELEGGTEITLSELGIDGAATRITVEQGLGNTISRVKKLVDPASSYEVETASAVAAVRGTTLSVSVNVAGITVVTNIEGLVSVTAQGVEVDLEEGERTTVEPGEPPAPPEPTATPQRGSPTPTQDIVEIGLEKTCNNQSAFPGDNLTYIYRVSNDGDVPLSNITVTDNKAGQPAYADGDDNSDGILDEGEMWIFTADYTVKGDEAGLLTNTATASGTGPGGQPASDSALLSVTITDIVVEITSLTPGEVVGNTIIVAGTVNDPSITEAVLTVNSTSWDIDVIEGQFSETVELAGGVTNVITVTVTKAPDITRSATVMLEPEPGGK